MVSPEAQHSHALVTRDQELLQRYRAGDTSVLAELFTTHQPRALKQARAITGDALLAEDIVSEAFLKCVSALENGKGPTVSFGLYLRSCVNSVIADAQKNIERPVEQDFFLSFEEARVESHPEMVGGDLVISAFHQLAPEHQRVIWLKDVQGLPLRDVADELSQPVNTVKFVYRRAREKFRTEFLAQVAGDSVTSACKGLIRDTAKYASGKLRRSKAGPLEAHLEDCVRCAHTVSGLQNIVKRFLVVLPLALGIGEVMRGSSKASAAFATSSASVTAQAGGIAAKVALAVAGVATVSGAGLWVLAAGATAPIAPTFEAGSPSSADAQQSPQVTNDFTRDASNTVSQQSGVHTPRPSHDATRAAATEDLRPETTHTSSGCALSVLPGDTQHGFSVENTGSLACYASVFLDGELLYETGLISQRLYYDTPQYGAYDVVISTGVEERRLQFSR